MMGNFYKMISYSPCAINWKSVPDKFKDACFGSNFQYIDPSQVVRLDLKNDCEPYFPDFVDFERIPLISDRFKSILDDFGVDNLLYAKVELFHKPSSQSIECWLALPPRILCIDWSESKYNSQLSRFDKMVIAKRFVGRYDIFKSADRNDKRLLVDNDIFVTERLRKYIEDKQEELGIELDNLDFFELDE